MRKRYVMAALTLLAVSSGLRGGEVPELQGTWVQAAMVTTTGRYLIAVEGGGEITTTFAGDKVAEVTGKGEPWRGTFRVGAPLPAGAIDLVYDPDPRIPELPGQAPKPTTFQCFYRVEKDALKIHYSLKDRPKDFVPREEEDFVIEFKRRK